MTLFYTNMTVSLCIRQGSKRNDDSVSVEELDWSAESQVLIPAEHLWCDFKCRPWAKNSSQNTNDGSEKLSPSQLYQLRDAIMSWTKISEECLRNVSTPCWIYAMKN